MNTYKADIDNGDSTKMFNADSAAEALVQAIQWAQDGDWPETGCTIEVNVTNVDDEDDAESETVTILSAEERQSEKVREEGEVLFEDVGEWTTNQVVRVGEDYFRLRTNGGERGAYDPKKFTSTCENIDQTEARRLGLTWGYSASEVATETKL